MDGGACIKILQHSTKDEMVKRKRGEEEGSKMEGGGVGGGGLSEGEGGGGAGRRGVRWTDDADNGVDR